MCVCTVRWELLCTAVYDMFALGFHVDRRLNSPFTLSHTHTHFVSAQVEVIEKIRENRLIILLLYFEYSFYLRYLNLCNCVTKYFN